MGRWLGLEGLGRVNGQQLGAMINANWNCWEPCLSTLITVWWRLQHCSLFLLCSLMQFGLRSCYSLLCGHGPCLLWPGKEGSVSFFHQFLAIDSLNNVSSPSLLCSWNCGRIYVIIFHPVLHLSYCCLRFAISQDLRAVSRGVLQISESPFLLLCLIRC